MAKKGLIAVSAATIAGIAALYKIGSDELKKRADRATEEKELEELFNETDENGVEIASAEGETAEDESAEEVDEFEISESYDDETIVDILRDGADVVKVGLDVVVNKVKDSYADYQDDPEAFKARAKEYAADKAEDAKDFASDTYETAKDYATEKYGEAKEYATAKYGEAKDLAVEKYGEAKDIAIEKYGEAKNYATEKYEAAKDFATEKIDDVKVAASEKLDQAKNFATEKIDNLRDTSSLDDWEDDIEVVEVEAEAAPIEEGEIDIIEIDSKKDKKKDKKKKKD